MKIDGLWNGEHKITSYAEKVYYRDNPEGEFTQVRRAFFKDISENPNAEFAQFYQYDNTPPTIVITSSTENIVVAAYTLTGRITDEHSGVANVTINNVLIELDENGYFSKNYTLTEGNNTFTIVATDVAGNISTKSAVVVYVNQKNNASYNWSNRYEVTNTSTNNRGETATANSRYVRINGIGYVYFQQIPSKAYYDHDGGGYHFTTAIANINSTIPLPKGIKSISVTGTCGGICGYPYTPGGLLTFTVKDNTTNTTIATNSRSSAGWLSLGANISQEQSTHDLYLVITGHGSGTDYNSTFANCGATEVSFTYY